MERTGSLIVYSLFSLTLILVLLGVVMVLSASQVVFTVNPDNNVYNSMGRQLMFVSAGLAAMGLFASFDYTKWEYLSRPIFLFALFLLLLVFSPLGVHVNGAYRWIIIPIINVRFQPSDFAKIAVIMYLSTVWAGRFDRLESFLHGVLNPMLVMSVLFLLLLMEPDHGTTVFIGCVMMSIWFVAGARMKHLGLFFVGFASSVLLALYFKPNLLRRILDFVFPKIKVVAPGLAEKALNVINYFDPELALQANKAKLSDQAYQATVALANGGTWGVGLGESESPRHLPEPTTDFIFAVMGEELGFIKTSVFLAMVLLLVVLGYYVAMKCRSKFGQLLVVGCTTALGLQAALNLAVVTGLLPVTGISLPFISRGGSSLIISMSLIGIIVSVARETFGINPKRSTQ